MAITLWGRASSSNVQKVRWALGELDLEYQHIPVGGRFGGNRDADYLSMNPNGLVPTLRDDDLVVWESHAILRYLAAEYGAGILWPESPRDRAVCDQWTDWAVAEFQKGWIEVFWLLVRTPEEQREAAKIARGIALTEKLFGILDQRLAQSRWLGGDRFSYADIPAGTAMFRWTQMAIDRQQHPHVERWHGALRERPAFREAVEVDYTELVGRLSF